MFRVYRSIAPRAMSAFLVVVPLTWALSLTAAHATTIPVTSTADDYEQGPNGNCTLREAVIAANTNTKTDQCPKGGGPDTIVIPAGTYTLTIPGIGEDAAHSGDLDVTAGVTITGAGVGATVIDVGGLDNGFEVRVKSGTSTISDLTIRHAGGVGIANRGSKLLLTDVAVEDSIGLDPLSDPPVGGAIYQTAGTLTATRVDLVGTEGGPGWRFAGGTATLDDCRVRDTDVFISPGGGGVTITGGVVSITASVIGDDTVDPLTSCANRARYAGGGVFVSGGHLELADSVVAGNCAGTDFDVGGRGGGLAVGGGEVHVVRTRIARNLAWPDRFSALSDGGGIAVDAGSLVVEDSRITENLALGLAGGMSVELAASVELVRSSVDGNAYRAVSAQVDAGGRFVVKDSTITGGVLGTPPTQFLVWGGLDTSGDVEIAGSTIDAGLDPLTAVAVLSSHAGTVSVRGSIIDGSCALGTSGAIVSQGYNLASDASCALGQSTDLAGVDPLLASLGFYGGPTPTRPPLPGSAAIDSGDPNGCSATDQRGLARPADGDLDGTARCDRGAVEVACSGIDGSGDECVPLACGAIPRTPGRFAATVAPLAFALVAVRSLRARRVDR